ncbi:hypothetical protein A4U64_26675 (plasmid) [Rhodococcus sp. WB1]|uniref:hypothetical protein n=1 Tax=Rhodococcus sp. WB1 TaxID=1033922 RepID=UPI00081A99B5|nr:hypothetical protein [Rhodococcus sp. WB1]ANZ28479.1 hypothetical protein A4U64_26675 [Rhodococcus sp. WB1]
MTPDELTLEADYFRDRLRRHNVYLHGWGVVCGALVCPVPNEHGGTKPWMVQVQPGYVLGPYGDEILIDFPREVSLQGNATVADPDDADDVWCTEVRVEQPEGPRYVAVRYREVPARPVRAQPAECGCDETPCEYSRYCDGYEIRALTLDGCPNSHLPPEDVPTTGNPTCPPVPDSPWVVLAEVTLEDDGTITKIDNCACRRIVVSAQDNWRTCASNDVDTPAPQDEAEPTEPTDGTEPKSPAGDRGSGDSGGGGAGPRASRSRRTPQSRTSGDRK